MIARAAARTPRAGIRPHAGASGDQTSQGTPGASARPSALPGPAVHRAAEVAWTLIPAAALALVLLFTWRGIH
ncbi:MAG TPA: hypothetical protein VFK13_09595 [Gemmatimonadaceae bacterium]|nr:hypothetical protein [Gemmatimonadaceae bacterium]